MLHLFEAIKMTVVYFCDLKAVLGGGSTNNNSQVARRKHTKKFVHIKKPLSFGQY